MKWFKKFRRKKKLAYYAQKYATEQDLQAAHQLQSYLSRTLQSSEKYSNSLKQIYHE